MINVDVDPVYRAKRADLLAAARQRDGLWYCERCCILCRLEQKVCPICGQGGSVINKPPKKSVLTAHWNAQEALTEPPRPSILEEAQQVIADRRARVDGPEGNFERIAKVWSVVFEHEVTARQVALCMIGLKFARECYSHWRDNLTDLAGYADCLAVIEGEYEDKQDASQKAECEKQPFRRTSVEELNEWLKGLKAKEPVPAPGQGRPNLIWCDAGTNTTHCNGSNVVASYAEGDTRGRQASPRCSCGADPRHCIWPHCGPLAEQASASPAARLS